MSETRIDSAVSGGSVKRLVFLPSGKIVWFVVGTDDEHWVDPDSGFCTCRDYYFKTLSGGPECYHLKSVSRAIETCHYVTISFEDSEYAQMLKAIIEDMVCLLARR
jgi:predicted nucleic acid-binding Zn finger protein